MNMNFWHFFIPLFLGKAIFKTTFQTFLIILLSKPTIRTKILSHLPIFLSNTIMNYLDTNNQEENQNILFSYLKNFIIIGFFCYCIILVIHYIAKKHLLDEKKKIELKED